MSIRLSIVESSGAWCRVDRLIVLSQLRHIFFDVFWLSWATIGLVNLLVNTSSFTYVIQCGIIYVIILSFKTPIFMRFFCFGSAISFANCFEIGISLKTYLLVRTLKLATVAYIFWDVIIVPFIDFPLIFLWTFVSVLSIILLWGVMYYE